MLYNNVRMWRCQLRTKLYNMFAGGRPEANFVAQRFTQTSSMPISSPYTISVGIWTAGRGLPCWYPFAMGLSKADNMGFVWASGFGLPDHFQVTSGSAGRHKSNCTLTSMPWFHIHEIEKTLRIITVIKQLNSFKKETENRPKLAVF